MTACAWKYLIEEEHFKHRLGVSHRAHQLQALPRSPGRMEIRVFSVVSPVTEALPSEA